MRLRVLAIGFAAVGACSRAAPKRAPAAPAPIAAQAPQRLTMLEGGYQAARAEATRRNLPLFVEVWASWCHTCMSMKQYVLPDAALSQLADSFVWLAIDSERAESAAFLQRFASRSLPTLWVIDPRSERPLLKWIGAATAPELASILTDTLRELRDEASPVPGEATALWVRGDRASAAGETDQAIARYREALAVAPENWDKRARAVEALSMRLSEAGQHAACFELAEQQAAVLPPGTSLVNVVVNGIDAANELPDQAPERARLPALLRVATSIAENPRQPVLLDDRSSLFLALVDALKTSQPGEAHRLALVWSGLLDAAAASAGTPAARSVWDAHRLDAYLALDQAARAIPMLEQSEREQPADFNAPARLARAYLALGRAAEAHAALDRALPRCEGPRKLRLYLLKADALLAEHDRAGARSVLAEALSFARAAKLSAQYDRLRELIERRARELS
jgi:tetratricopeptide (TPR) repeat protein